MCVDLRVTLILSQICVCDQGLVLDESHTLTEGLHNRFIMVNLSVYLRGMIELGSLPQRVQFMRTLIRVCPRRQRRDANLDKHIEKDIDPANSLSRLI
jgi:hypothetical protein